MELGPRLIFWEINQACNLKCPYCRRQFYAHNGLTQEAAQGVIDSVASEYQPLLVFSGGEPLLYPYIFVVASYARKKNLKIALATNGTLINADIVRKIKEVGFHRVAVSLDGATKEVNDSLRGEGVFLKTIAGIKYLKSQGVELQINTTVLKRNLKQIPFIYKLCLDLGIKALHIFAFVPVGCGINLPRQEMLSSEEYEVFLNKMADLSAYSPIEIKLTCAPHYQRILAQRQDNLSFKISQGCLAGKGVCFISGKGEVYPCGYLTLSAGNIFKEPFKKIWEESSLFQTLRQTNYLKGKCGSCEYVDICGGCRARAYTATGDYLAEEPECSYQPSSVKS